MPSDRSRPHVVVIGGGISGLSAAWSLIRPQLMSRRAVRSLQPRVTVIESSDRPGGKINTSEFCGVRVEEGPDAFITRSPWAMQLCRDLEIADRLVAPAQTAAWVWNHNGLVEYPKGTVLGVPSSIRSLVRSPLVSPRGVARAFDDLVLPRSGGAELASGDMTIMDALAPRLGREVVQRLIDPLVGGINAAGVDTLSVRSAAPQIAELLSRPGSVMRSAKSKITESAALPKQPIFQTTDGGLSNLVHMLEGTLREAGVIFEYKTRVLDLRASTTDAHSWSIVAEHRAFDNIAGVVVATPAPVSASLLRSIDNDLASQLTSITYSPVVMVRLAFRRSDIADMPQGSGFVVPAVDGRLMTACSWTSEKWAYSSHPEKVIMRVSTGRHGDIRAMELSDTELIDRLTAELGEAMSFQAQPTEADVIRYPQALPHYEAGHIDRVEEIDRRLTQHSGIALAGAAYDGLGLPACIHSGERAAERLLNWYASAHQISD